MVFTGDHFNSPPDIAKLQKSGVFTRERADQLRNLPLQDCDLLLHEAGVPPIHTPISVLLQLPQAVKDRLYVVHTSALPEGCELRVAPPGTANTIRLDQINVKGRKFDRLKASIPNNISENDPLNYSSYATNSDNELVEESLSQRIFDRKSSLRWSSNELTGQRSSFRKRPQLLPQHSIYGKGLEPPLVALRPASHTDPWFILNLLSSVPFLTSLSYTSTMEVLEAARVDAFSINEIVIPSYRRKDQLCVIWEGTCVERPVSMSVSCSSLEVNEERRGLDAKQISSMSLDNSSCSMADKEISKKKHNKVSVWHAGDWTGPRTLQPEKRLSGVTSKSQTHDIVAMSKEGVKAITVEFSLLHDILKNGSALYRKYLQRKSSQHAAQKAADLVPEEGVVPMMKSDAVQKLSVIELLDCNSALRKLTAVQKRHLESLAEGPIYFAPAELLWKAGATVDKAFILVEGTAAFRSKQRTGKSTLGYKSRQWGSKISNPPTTYNQADGVATASKLFILKDALKIRDEMKEELGDDWSSEGDSSISSSNSEEKQYVSFENIGSASASSTRSGKESKRHSQDFAKIKDGLRKRADVMNKSHREVLVRGGSDSSTGIDSSNSRLHDSDSTSSHDDTSYIKFPSNDKIDSVSDSLPASFTSSSPSDMSNSMYADNDGNYKRMKFIRRRSSRDRFANKVLGRLYSQRIFTSDLVFSRGHFLGDVSKMVAGLLSRVRDDDEEEPDDDSLNFGYGDKAEGIDPTKDAVGEITIHERAGDELVVHNTTLAAGENGCVVIIFPKASLIPFLDEYPGLLLSLLGTQVVV